ncbi:MAG: hypothetical protein NWF01_01550 [Candidatus Bathyarchaeota archaeon]|nr:hypothetical protein [Candidatus Bathyarchaeota archaeon]
MTGVKLNLPVKLGLLLVALSYFTFTIYEFLINIIHGGGPSWGFWIYVTDTASAFGLGLRVAAGLIAVVTVVAFLFREKIAVPEVLLSLKWLLLFEAGYNLVTFFPSTVWAVLQAQNFGDPYAVFMYWTLPCAVESIAIPAALAVLILKISPNKPAKNAIRWAFIAGAVYLFGFWVNNFGNWIGAVIERGNQYLIAEPLNIFSFAVTAVGLLTLTIYSAVMAKRATREDFVAVRAAAVILIGLGLYYFGTYLQWIVFGNVGGWSMWNAWFLGHNVDLWIMMLPILGLPLLFYSEKTQTTTKPSQTSAAT